MKEVSFWHLWDKTKETQSTPEKELFIHVSISQSVFSGIPVLGRLIVANIKQSVLCSNEFLKTWVNQVKLVSSFNMVRNTSRAEVIQGWFCRNNWSGSLITRTGISKQRVPSSLPLTMSSGRQVFAKHFGLEIGRPSKSRGFWRTIDFKFVMYRHRCYT